MLLEFGRLVYPSVSQLLTTLLASRLLTAPASSRATQTTTCQPSGALWLAFHTLLAFFTSLLVSRTRRSYSDNLSFVVASFILPPCWLFLRHSAWNNLCKMRKMLFDRRALNPVSPLMSCSKSLCTGIFAWIIALIAGWRLRGQIWYSKEGFWKGGMFIVLRIRKEIFRIY